MTYKNNRVTKVVALIAAAATTFIGVSTSQAATTTTSPIVKLALNAGQGFRAHYVEVQVDPASRALLPKSVLASGQLQIGVGALPSGFPPLVFTGTDQQTIVGSEPDLGRLIAAVLGLQPVITNYTFANMFVGVDSGRVDLALSNIGITEPRKAKYDFASYRTVEYAFEALRTNPWKFTGYESLANHTFAVAKGTNQELFLLGWQKKLQAEGKNFKIQYFPDSPSTYLALDSGRIDAIFSVNPSTVYDVKATRNAQYPTKVAGTFGGTGPNPFGFIGATTKKDNGEVAAFASAINYLIQNGQYAKWLDTYGLSAEAIQTSQINPYGIPVPTV